MRRELSPRSERDLEEIGDYIAKDNPDRAVSFMRELPACCFDLANQPGIGAPRFDWSPGLRIHPHGRYLIAYTTTDTTVRIQRIVHSARDLSGIFGG